MGLIRERKVRANRPETKMNKTEKRYADHLWLRKKAGEVRRYEFEPIKLRLGNDSWYTPDFLVELSDDTVEIHEVKGFWREAARVRIKVAATGFPLFRFVAVQWVDRNWKFEEIKPHA